MDISGSPVPVMSDILYSICENTSVLLCQVRQNHKFQELIIAITCQEHTEYSTNLISVEKICQVG